MKTALKLKSAALALAMLLAPQAQAIPSPTTTTTGVVLVAAGAAVYFLVIKPKQDKKAGQKKADDTKTGNQAALLYLRLDGLELAENLAVGEGPALEDLAVATGIPPEHRASFRQLLSSHADELLTLAHPVGLTEERAGAFVLRCAALIDADPQLGADFQRFAAAAPHS